MATNISVSGLTANSGVKQVTLTWETLTPGCSGPGGLPYLGISTVEVWASATNQRASAVKLGVSPSGIYVHSGLSTSQTYYYWVRPVDASGQLGSYFPVSATSGIVGTTQNEVPPAGSVGTTQIAPNAVTNTQIADGSISTPKIQTNSITSDRIAANAVQANAIAANAVTAGKIAADAVTSSTIAANAVTAGKIAAGSIAADRIDANGISASQIKTGTLNASLITVTNLNASSITAGTLTADRIAVLDAANLMVGSATNITSTQGLTHTFNSSGGSHLIISTVNITSGVVTNIPFPQATVQLYLDSVLQASRVVFGYVGSVSGSNFFTALGGTALLVIHVPLPAGPHTLQLVVANVTAGVSALSSNPYIISFESRR